MLAIGDAAPSLSLPDAQGDLVSLADLWAKGPLVVYFYPKDETSGCRAQACEFRDRYAQFQDAGAEVVGISGDDGDSHAKFTERHRLPFILLSDTQAEARKAFGVRKTLGLIPGRVTFVIDTKGTIQHVFDSQLRATQHVEEAIKVIERLKG